MKVLLPIFMLSGVLANTQIVNYGNRATLPFAEMDSTIPVNQPANLLVPFDVEVSYIVANTETAKGVSSLITGHTVRVSWPATTPSDITLDLYQPVTSNHSEAYRDSIVVRITAKFTGVSIFSGKTPSHVELVLVHEPLYLAIPASVYPILATILLVLVAVYSLDVAGLIWRFLISAAPHKHHQS